MGSKDERRPLMEAVLRQFRYRVRSHCVHLDAVRDAYRRFAVTHRKGCARFAG